MSCEHLKRYMEWLEAQGYSPEAVRDFEAECINREADMRKRRDRDLEDVEIARLIPHGIDRVMERFGGSRRHGFRRAARGRQLARRSATPAIGDGTNQ